MGTPDPILIPFLPEHLSKFYNRDGWSREDWKLAIERQASGPAYTATVDGKILGSAGVMLPWPGMGTVWVCISDDMGQYGFWFCKACRRVLNDVIRSFNLHRVEAVVMNDEVNIKWAQFMGFTREVDGIARNYAGRGGDVFRYELLPELPHK